MLEIRAKLKMRRDAYRVAVAGRLELSFEARRANGLRAKLHSGEEVALMLPHGEILRGGDLATASDGRVIEIVAAREKLLHIESRSLAKVAYRLGNRHVPVEFGEAFLRVADDHAAEQMLRELGATVSRVEAPFEPEAGAHAGDQPHQHGSEHDHRDHDHHHGHDHDH